MNFRVQWIVTGPDSHLVHRRNERQEGVKKGRKVLSKNICNLCLCLISRESVSDKAGVQTTGDKGKERSEKILFGRARKSHRGQLQICTSEACTGKMSSSVDLPGKSSSLEAPESPDPEPSREKQCSGWVPIHTHPEVMDRPIRF